MQEANQKSEKAMEQMPAPELAGATDAAGIEGAS